MQNLIVNVRGPSGSGKTTVARKFITDYPHDVISGSDGKIKGYKVDVSSEGINSPLYIVGSYANTCGGLDGLPDQATIADRIVKAQEFGHVLAEGLLTSKSGPGGHVAPILKDHGAVFAFLDTPLEECIMRVKSRRVAAGNEKTFDPHKSLIPGHECCIRCAELLKQSGGYDVRHLDWKNPFKEVLSIFQEFENA